jgi:hypothetical protein
VNRRIGFPLPDVADYAPILHVIFRGAHAFGFGSGVFFLGYCLFEVPSNLILHRVGARLRIARIMISWGIIASALMFVRTPARPSHVVIPLLLMCVGFLATAALGDSWPALFTLALSVWPV